jgi:hypothetical protein
MTRKAIVVVSTLLLAFFSLPRYVSSSQNELPVLNIGGDTVILAKLMTNVDLEKCAPGEQFEAQTASDIKQGKEVVLKKGASLLGHVVSVKAANDKQTQSIVVVVFDTAKTKNSGPQTLHLLIRALAPESEAPSNSTISGGRGMPGEDTHAAISGGDHAETGGVGRLTTSSVGVSGLPGLQLGIQKSTSGQQMSVLTWSNSSMKLKKGMQMAFLVVGQ